jgi:isopenicillin N synthase-like dioxygenase
VDNGSSPFPEVTMLVLSVPYGAPDCRERLARSLRETGFAVLTTHPVSPETISSTYREWEGFFATEAKHAYLFDKVRQDGYFPFRSENAKGFSQKDLKEFYHVYPDTRLPEGMSEGTHRLYASLASLAGEILGWVEDETPIEIRGRLSMPLRDMIKDSPQTLFRILHYPPLDGTEEEGAVRAAAHEDINLVTLLVAATAPGLEVRDGAGNWHEVPADPGSVIVNAGDMLQMATEGYYRSTTHRVVNPPGAEGRKARLSMPLFLHPWPHVRLSPTHTAGEYLDERLREIGLK